MLAEDNIYNQEVAVQSMTKKVSDLVIDIAADGNEVLELLQENDYDVVLMDVQMPGMDGYEATKRIRTDFNDDKKNIPIIALTASATKEEINAGFDAGMNAYIAKPFRPAHLLHKIAEQLNKHATFKQSIVVNNRHNNRLTDLTLLNEITAGDLEQVKKLVNRFITESIISFEKMDQLIREGNYPEVKKQLHILRPQAESLGIKSLAELLHITEQTTNNPDALSSQLKAGRKICIAAIEELRKEVNT